MKESSTISTLLRYSLTIFLGLAAHCMAIPLELSFTAPENINEFSSQALLEWNAPAAGVYLVQSATDLSPGSPWKTEIALRATQPGPLKWMAPESIRDSRFYRLVLPGTELFTLEPAFVDSADKQALLYITGQMLPEDCTFIINGQGFSPLQIAEDGSWAAISLTSLPPSTRIGGTVLLLDGKSNTVATLTLQGPVFHGPAATQEQLQGPAEEPPASPDTHIVEELEFVVEKVERARNFKGATRSVRYATDPYVETSQRMWLGRKGYEYYRNTSDLRGRSEAFGSVALGSGEFQYQATDLAIEGRGLSFEWTRTYRSRTGPTTALGAGWDFSYNVSLSQQPDGTVVLRPGNGRADTFYPDGTNGWTRDEYFVEVRDLNGDGMPDVLFADTGKWLFHPSGTAEGGKLSQIVDRNGNTTTLFYNTSGKLASIVDSLDRTNTLAYNTKGFIEAVTDFSGRTVRYEYDNEGNLVTQVSPPVTDTPTANDFPGGKTNRFTYTRGHSDDRLNHNLTSISDPKNQVCLEIAYQAATDPASVDFDAVSSLQRGIDKKDIRRSMVIVRPGSYAAVQAIVNDYEGNVTEYLFDARQRCVSEREFTGRANPVLPTTTTENRPKGKLRNQDPDYFETRWEWNADSLCTREIRPDGSSTETSHQRAQDHNSSRSNKTASRRHDGNVRVVREVAGSPADLDGDGTLDAVALTWYFEYDPRFGSPGNSRGKKIYVGNLPFSGDSSASRSGWFGTVKRPVETAKVITDRDSGRSKGFGFVTQAIDPRGLVSSAQYDDNGNCTKSIKQGHYAVSNFHIEIDAAYNTSGQLTALTNAPDLHGLRRVDTISYYPSGSQRGMVEVLIGAALSGGLALRTAFEHDLRGNVTRLTDPRGNDTLFAYNALDQCVEAQTPAFGAGAGLPPQRITTRYFYDANDNLIRSAVENRDEKGTLDKSNPEWATLLQYDSRDRLEAVVQEISEGGGLPGRYATNRLEYSPNDNVIEVHSPLAVSGMEPQNSTSFEYDERGLLFRKTAAPGSLVQSSTQYDYDLVGNLSHHREGLENGPALTTFKWHAQNFKYVSGGGKAQGVMGAKAKAWMVNNYEVHRMFAFKKFDWAPKLEGGKEGLAAVTAAQNDENVGLASVTDPMGNVTLFHYDLNGNVKGVLRFGETNDVPGGLDNRLLADTRFTYDSFDRCVLKESSFFSIPTSAQISDGKATMAFAYSPNGACTNMTDDNRHTTSFDYDEAGRLASITDARLNVVKYFYDACNNLIETLSNERSDVSETVQQFSITRSYDALNQCITSTDNVGNTDRYGYDSRGNVVSHLDPRANEAVSVFDGLARCVGTVDFAGKDRAITISTSHVEYDANSRRTASTDSNGNTTTYAYDDRDRCVAVTGADNTRSTLIWSPRSNLIAVRDANGTTVTNTYDLCDRIIHRDIAARAPAAATTTFEAFAYDGLSRCVGASNDVSLVTFAYDSLGRCIHTAQDGLTSTAVIDGVGNRLALTYPSGRIVSFGYDTLNQLTNIDSSAGAGLPTLTYATYYYDGPGRLGRVLRANNVVTRYQWNGVVNQSNAPEDFGWRQVSGVNHQESGGGAVIDRRVSSFDPNQNRLSRVQHAPFFKGGPLRTNQFAYDTLNRLTGNLDSVLGLVRVYELDGNGNRSIVLSNRVPQVYTMDNAFPDPADFQMNQYTVTPFGAQSYDLNGNLITRLSADGLLQFHYDYADRLVLVEIQGADGTSQRKAAFAYDALGRRISKTSYPPAPLAPATMQYVYGGGDCDDAAEEVLEVRSGAVVAAVYVGGGAAAASYAATGRVAPALVTFNAAGQPVYLHADDMGNVLALTDAGGLVLERYDYDEFGQPVFLTDNGLSSSATGSSVGNVFLFHGMEWDVETGLYYSRGGGSRHSNPLYNGSSLEGNNPLYGGHYVDSLVGSSLGLPKITPKISKESHGRAFHGSNPWSPGITLHGTGQFLNQSRGFGLAGNGSYLSRVVKLIVPVAMDKGLRFAVRAEGGRHTPFHNPYRPQFRKILDYGEAGDNVPLLASTHNCNKCKGRYIGHVSLLK